MTVYIIALGIIGCLCLSALFSATEMAYSSCSPLRIENLMEEGSARAKVARYIIDHFDNALSTILIGNNLANIAGSSLVSVFLIVLLGDEKGAEYAWIGTVVMTLLVIICGETIPKITAKKNANRFALSFAYIVRALMIILSPVVWIVVKLIRLFTLPFKGVHIEEDSDEAVEELQNIIETAEDEDVLDEERSELVMSAIDFSDTAVSEVMTARVDVCALDADAPWEEIIATVENSSYSRLPVYEGSIDNIIGILYLNRFLKKVADGDKADIRSLLMPAVYVYKTQRLPAVLGRLRKARQHLAVVSDEYGGMLGVVSMEDVLEEIVGDIWDEEDPVEEGTVRNSEGEYELDGDMSISEFLELMDINENSFEAESETVGGWTVEMFGEFPKEGDSFSFRNLKVSVKEMDGHRVDRVTVSRIPGEE